MFHLFGNLLSRSAKTKRKPTTKRKRKSTTKRKTKKNKTLSKKSKRGG